MYVQVEARNFELKILLFEVDLEVLEENVVKKKKEKLMVVNQLQIVLIKFLTNEFFLSYLPYLWDTIMLDNTLIDPMKLRV